VGRRFAANKKKITAQAAGDEKENATFAPPNPDFFYELWKQKKSKQRLPKRENCVMQQVLSQMTRHLI
jgi:hypothetical protein